MAEFFHLVPRLLKIPQNTWSCLPLPNQASSRIGQRSRLSEKQKSADQHSWSQLDIPGISHESVLGQAGPRNSQLHQLCRWVFWPDFPAGLLFLTPALNPKPRGTSLHTRPHGPSTSFLTARLLPQGSLSSWLPALILNADVEIPTGPRIWHYPLWKSRRYVTQVSVHSPPGWTWLSTCHCFEKYLKSYHLLSLPPTRSCREWVLFQGPLALYPIWQGSFYNSPVRLTKFVSPVPNAGALFWRTSFHLH